MWKKFLVSVPTAVCAMLACSASLADTSLGLRASTLGAGIELAHAFNERFGMRIGANGLKHDTTETYQDVEYDANLKLATGQLLFDWFPFSNNFRFSGGGMYNGNKLTLAGKPSANGTYTFNGITYNASDVGTVDGKVDFRKFAPYLGLGYGRPVGRGFSLTADLGVMFQGSPSSTLTATCGPTSTPTNCAQLQSDIATAQAQLDEDAQKYKYYPVLSIGLAYVF